MSLTSYRAAPPRGNLSRAKRRMTCHRDPRAWKTWQRPTLPCLETQYHRRWEFSRPSSEWDRVFTSRYCHQVVEAQGKSLKVRAHRSGRSQRMSSTARNNEIKPIELLVPLS